MIIINTSDMNLFIHPSITHTHNTICIIPLNYPLYSTCIFLPYPKAIRKHSSRAKTRTIFFLNDQFVSIPKRDISSPIPRKCIILTMRHMFSRRTTTNYPYVYILCFWFLYKINTRTQQHKAPVRRKFSRTQASTIVLYSVRSSVQYIHVYAIHLSRFHFQ